MLGSQACRFGKRHLRWFHGLAFCCLFFFLVVNWTGCGSSGSSGTPPGTYNLMLTGTTSGVNVLKHSLSLTLIVQ